MEFNVGDKVILKNTRFVGGSIYWREHLNNGTILTVKEVKPTNDSLDAADTQFLSFKETHPNYSIGNGDVELVEPFIKPSNNKTITRNDLIQLIHMGRLDGNDKSYDKIYSEWKETLGRKRRT